MNEIVKLFKKILEIESISGKEKKILRFLKTYIEKLNFRVFMQKIGNLIINPKANFWIITHVDTVKPKRSFEFKGDFIYGTGASDAKGQVLSILLFLKEIKKLNLGVCFTVDEEETGKGSKYLAKTISPRKALVLEPTSLKIVKEHFGNIEVEVKVKGKSVHPAFSNKGKNAIEESCLLVKKLKDRLKGTLISLYGLKTNFSEYVIPDECKLNLDILIRYKENIEEIREKILKISKNFGEIKIREQTQPFLCDEEIIQFLKKAFYKKKVRPKYTQMRSWTDACNLKKANWKVCVWGPGELVSAHTKDEKINLKEIIFTKDILKIINSMLS